MSERGFPKYQGAASPKARERQIARGAKGLEAMYNKGRAEAEAACREELAALRQKAAAWDFLLAYNDPDPVPGATLGDYIDAAWTYAQEQGE